MTWNSSADADADADADDVDEYAYMETVIIIVNIASLIKWNWIRSGMQVWQFTFLEITCDANEPDNNVNVEDWVSNLKSRAWCDTRSWYLYRHSNSLSGGKHKDVQIVSGDQVKIQNLKIILKESKCICILQQLINSDQKFVIFEEERV